MKTTPQLISSEMGTVETISAAAGYEKPPWVFRGRALYQFHLVKAETARAFVPKGSKLIEAFGHTLGGFFLAYYQESPVGSFDELVVLAGLVWNSPTSCAWAARVLVSSDQACVHGKRVFGLPSHVATFTKTAVEQSLKAVHGPKRSLFGSILNKIGLPNSCNETNNLMDVQVKETNKHKQDSFLFGLDVIYPDSTKWMGPAVKLSLPSISGRTEYVPDLLEYSCQMKCRVRVVAPTKVLCPTSDTDMDESIDSDDIKRNLSISVMLSKPILALEFNTLEMKVDDPTVVSQNKVGRSGFGDN